LYCLLLSSKGMHPVLRTGMEESVMVMAEGTLLTRFSNKWTSELAGGIMGLAWPEGPGDDAFCGRFRFLLFALSNLGGDCFGM